MVKRIKWEKLAVENKKCAVLAIFYCGLQSVKSFHISPLDRRDCKDRHNFGICKTKPTAWLLHILYIGHFGGNSKIVAAEPGRSPLFSEHLFHFGGDGCPVVAELLVEHLVGGRPAEMVETVDHAVLAHQSPEIDRKA